MSREVLIQINQGGQSWDESAGMQQSQEECVMRWPMFEQVTRQAQHMSDMMDRLDVDCLAAVRHERGRAYAEAREACLHCPFARECAQRMADAGGVAILGAYCPNARFFEAFRRRRGLSTAAETSGDETKC